MFVDRLVVIDGRTLTCGDLTVRCAVGRTGVSADKHEGDGATPAGVFPLRLLLFRADRVPAVESGLPVRTMQPNDGWCDEAGSRLYNQAIRLPSDLHHEELWRDDHLYDVLVVIGYNDAPIVAGRGSAIFLHVAAPDFAPTDGCVAIEQSALLRVAQRCGPSTMIEIRA